MIKNIAILINKKCHKIAIKSLLQISLGFKIDSFIFVLTSLQIYK
jgi:hypothetical protein